MGLDRMYKERYKLAFNRIKEIISENTVKAPFRSYFEKLSEFIMLLDNVEATEEYNKTLYNDILPANYDTCYGNPDYIVKAFTEAFSEDKREDITVIAKYLCYLYAEIIGLIPYAYENNIEILTIYFELFLEVYFLFEDDEVEDPKAEA